MNENIDLTKILKNCPKNVVFYSSIFGNVIVCIIEENENYPIAIYKPGANEHFFLSKLTKEGKYNAQFDGECTLFPSKDQRDWSEFTAPWYNNDKNEKFNPETLKPFDRVLIRDEVDGNWKCDLFSYIEKCVYYPYKCVASSHIYCIPYNDDTKYLVGTKEEAPEYYRYWED